MQRREHQVCTVCFIAFCGYLICVVELEHRHDGIIYKEIEDSRGGLKAACMMLPFRVRDRMLADLRGIVLVSSDGKRIYWKVRESLR